MKVCKIYTPEDIAEEIKGLNKWKPILRGRIEDSTLLRCLFYAKLIYRFNAIKVPRGFFLDIGKTILKFI